MKLPPNHNGHEMPVKHCDFIDFEINLWKSIASVKYCLVAVKRRYESLRRQWREEEEDEDYEYTSRMKGKAKKYRQRRRRVSMYYTNLNTCIEI